MDFGSALRGNMKITGKQQSGEYDKYILCENCERKMIGSLESYAKEFLFGENLSKGNRFNRQLEKENILLSNVDYKKLKLFFLSILWRASISAKPFFNEVKLKEEIEEDLRQMIFTGNPMTNDDYPIYFFYDVNKISTQYIGQPTKTKNNDGFLFPFVGILAYFSLGNKNIPTFPKNCTLLDLGQLRLYILPNGEAWKLFRDIY